MTHCKTFRVKTCLTHCLCVCVCVSLSLCLSLSLSLSLSTSLRMSVTFSLSLSLSLSFSLLNFECLEACRCLSAAGGWWGWGWGGVVSTWRPVIAWPCHRLSKDNIMEFVFTSFHQDTTTIPLPYNTLSKFHLVSMACLLYIVSIFELSALHSIDHRSILQTSPSQQCMHYMLCQIL